MTGVTHDGRFASLNSLLRREGRGLPCLIIDLDLLDHNITEMAALQPAKNLRLVAKSLPAIGLLEYIAAQLWERTSSPRLMVFHLPFLQQLTRRFQGADILMGKPLPTAAIAWFFLDPHTADQNGGTRIQWLVDSPGRLEQLIALAMQAQRRLTISLELDIGMHRGGIKGTKALDSLLETIRSNARNIELGGFMGYDAHAAKAPWPRSAAKACERSARVYAEMLDLARANFPDLEEQPWCINGAGSPTLSLHGAASPLNDFSMGSALLKPAGFDVPALDNFKPAAWIATPVIKRLDGVQIPFLEKVPSGNRDSVFLYGGRWMATPASPASLQENKLYGLSSNQQLMTVAEDCGIAVDDYVFFRPNQSEAVLLQFGDIIAFRGDQVVARWPVLKNELSGDLDTANGESR